MPILQQWGTSWRDGDFTLWTKPSGQQTALSSPISKSHQPSARTPPPAQMGGLDGEGSSPTCLEELIPAGVCSSRSETNTAMAKVLPPDKHPLVCNTKAESVPTTHAPTQVRTAPRSILSLAHWALTAAARGTQWLRHQDPQLHPRQHLPGRTHPAPRAGGPVGQPEEDPAPGLSFLCSTQCSPWLGTAASSSSTAGKEGAQPDRHCPPHPGSKVTLNTHPVPSTPVSRSLISPICHARTGAHSSPDRSDTPDRDPAKDETCQAGGKMDPLRIKSSSMRNTAWGRRRGPGGSYSHGKHRALFSVIQDETTGI
ncbi:uncharacterized protein LOC113486522 isoform X2 [Athene cunicularia]|uniref:uncharacterized protein LOC113486522 isoform X1 n=1 Tax=Athene cunicularia TaxID=194338 RepID=UPI000EF693DB|nr:uncharacterized protein LOC113486522 isoform X1 [Athene cunicularia]XP_026716344.1 uncharacterized protein LOC113486522 isoform X2 [Athene cunicularia]